MPHLSHPNAPGHTMESLLTFDRRLFLLLNGRDWPAWLDHFFVFITEDEGLRIPMLLLWLFLMLACGPRWRRRALWLIPLIALSDSINSHLLKDIFARPRPCHEEIEGLRLLVRCGGGASFPSSHAANMGAAGTFLALGVIRWRWRWAILALPILVAYSRVHVGVHYPLDVIAGWTWAMGMAWGLDALARRVPRVGLNPEIAGKPPA